MGMLRCVCVCDMTQMDIIRNKCIKSLDVTNKTGKMKQNRLRYFEQAERKIMMI